MLLRPTRNEKYPTENIFEKILCAQGMEKFSNDIGVVNAIYFADWYSECNKMHKLHQRYVIESIGSVYYFSETCNFFQLLVLRFFYNIPVPSMFFVC
jgi:hypothetical protein